MVSSTGRSCNAQEFVNDQDKAPLPHLFSVIPALGENAAYCDLDSDAGTSQHCIQRYLVHNYTVGHREILVRRPVFHRPSFLPRHNLKDSKRKDASPFKGPIENKIMMIPSKCYGTPTHPLYHLPNRPHGWSVWRDVLYVVGACKSSCVNFNI